MPNFEILNPQRRSLLVEPTELARAILDVQRSSAGLEAELGTLTSQLQDVDPSAIESDDARIAFWLNLYNALLLDRLGRAPIAGSMLRHPGLFSRTAYSVGGRPFSLNLIEHGVLRLNRRPPYVPRRPLRRSDVRLGALPSRLDARIHFALNCGARSCPPIRTYSPATLDEDLERATRAYLESETRTDGGDAIVLPRLMRLYRGDFGDEGEQLAFAATRLPAVATALERPTPPRVTYGRFDWTATGARG